ncbi:hypothetical protein BBJ28_00009303 [Nothophytophthora sp. Chile5]|nr:hypothetical protein BBJ28_00009303 [Nothophytophthora sp. Chile5]
MSRSKGDLSSRQEGLGGDALAASPATSPVSRRLSPRASQHYIELDAMENASEHSTSDSPKRFACHFDPVSKKGKVLVLLFDRNAKATFKEMSRLDLLRMTQEAANVCLVYVPDGADSLLSILKEKFSVTMREDSEAPYEFRALEALLATLSVYFQADYEKLAPVVVTELERLVHGRMHSRELERLREFKNAMNEFEAQVDGVRRILMELLDNEEDLRLLYLTKLHQDPSLLQDLWSFDSEEAEVLIENYLQDIFSTRTRAELMQHRITNTESLVTLKLDSKRNYLLGVQLIFSLVAINISVGTLISGLFGTNLNSGLQSAAGWFWGVVIATVVLFVVMTWSGVMFFKRKGVLLK